MPYTYRLTRIIPATPLDVYEAWLDSEAHSQMTGAEARMSDKIGAVFSAWDDYISGRNLELVPGERIVQAWRTSKFTGENEDSIVTITLEEADDGTLLTLVHSNVPDEQRNHEEGRWESNYFAPMRAYFASLAEEDEADEEDVDELEEEEEEGEEADNGDEDDEDDEDEDEEDDEDEDEDGDEEEEDGDEDEDEEEEDEDEDEEDEDEEGELKEEYVAKGLEETEHAPPRLPAVKRTAGRPAKKPAPRAKALPGKKTKRAAAAPRRGKLKPKSKSKVMGKGKKKKTAAKRARPAVKKAKRAASKKKSAGRKRARGRAQRR
jgi:uncharacterized protein YndB with AHSA1/START domain